MNDMKPIPELSPIQDSHFWERVEIDMSDVDKCFPWGGWVDKHGYGIVKLGRRGNFKAHRVAYALIRGPIPAGLTLDHLCRNKRCCNPAHLEAVPAVVNVLRSDSPTARNARKTHCDNGHALNADNIIQHKRGYRMCRACFTTSTKATASRDRGLCVRCHKPSETYRCDRCRSIHNAKNMARKR